MAFEPAVIEDQVDKGVIVANQDALLAGLEAEAMAKLEQELLQMVEKLVLEVRLTHHLARFETKKFNDVGITNRQCWFKGLRFVSSELGELGLVFRERGGFVIKVDELAFELADEPISLDTFGQIEVSLKVVMLIDEELEMAMREPIHQEFRRDGQLWGRCPHN
jgi:hypothetical protein